MATVTWDSGVTSKSQADGVSYTYTNDNFINQLNDIPPYSTINSVKITAKFQVNLYTNNGGLTVGSKTWTVDNTDNHDWITIVNNEDIKSYLTSGSGAENAGALPNITVYANKRMGFARTFKTQVIITWDYTEHTHSYTAEIARTPSTCCEKGSVTYQCSCGETQPTELALDPNNHAGGTEIRNAVAATCTATGYTGDTYCKGCGVKLSSGSTIEKKTHTEVTIPAVAPTCTATGLTAGKKCSVCGTIITAQQTVAALGHTWVNATCTTPKTCSVCGTTEGSALDHNYTSVVTPPTETSRGYTTHTCSRCGHSYVDSYTYMLIATCDPSMGIVIQQGTGIYNHGDVVTLTAEAQTAYKFVKWSDGNTDNPRTVTVTANKTYTAIFERAYYELGLERSEGFSDYGFEIVSGSRYTDDNGVEHALKFIPGTVIAITANSEEGYIFSHWFDGNTDNPRQFTMSKDITLLAYFVKRPPEFTSVQMLYQNKQISKDNKVLTGEFFRIVVGAKSYD